jgi:hypothetical protein
LLADDCLGVLDLGGETHDLGLVVVAHVDGHVVVADWLLRVPTVVLVHQIKLQIPFRLFKYNN